jgi:hypothetical protein
MPFNCDLALEIYLSKPPFKMQPQFENEDVTRTNKHRALSLQEVKLDG